MFNKIIIALMVTISITTMFVNNQLEPSKEQIVVASSKLIEVKNEVSYEVATIDKISSLITPKIPDSNISLLPNKKEETKIEPVSQNSLDIDQEIIKAIQKVSEKNNLDYRYLMTICLSEGCRKPQDVGDNGCSFGIFQMNMCSGKGRWKIVYNGLKLKDCALNYECAADWTLNVHTIKKYCKIKNQQIESYIDCLSKHQGGNPATWYKEKIYRNALFLGLPK